MQGFIPSQGVMIIYFSSQGIGNPWKGSFPLQGMSIEGNPFHTQWNLGQGPVPMPRGLVGGIPNQGPWNTSQGEIHTQGMSYNYVNMFTMKNQVQNPFTHHEHCGFYQNHG
jgi:hypothetical protein